MMCNFKKKPYFFWIRLFIALVIFSLFIYSFVLEPDITLYDITSFALLDEDWVQIVDGEEVPIATAQDAVYGDGDDTVIIQTTIPPVVGDRSIVFYAIHQEVAVYVGDELVYSLTCPESMSFFDSPGRVWVDIPITYNMMGQTVRIEFSSPFSIYHNVPSDIYFIHASDIQTVQLQFMWLRNAVAIAIIALAIITYVNANIWKDPKLRHFLFTLADVYLFTGLWLCSEVNLLSVLVGHSAAASFLAMIFIRMVPVAFYHLIMASTSYHSRWMRILGVMAWGNMIGSVILQLAFGISLVATLPFTVLVFGVSTIGYLAGMVVRIKMQRYSRQYDKGYYASVVLLAGTMAEIYCYINQATLGQYNGVFVSIACIIYAILAHVFLVQNEADTDVAKRKLETDIQALEKKPLYQQINAHFLFNTLNGISAYCKEYPAKADQAVGWLAQYMRGYMRLVDCGEYVPFAEEVALIKIYLNIQNLRYEEHIDFVVDSPFDDFGLPPLTLQPLIENAINHGLHNYVDNGQICIRCRRYSDMVEMVVSDNGRGYETEDTRQSGIGLSNLTRRIKAMGGDLHVKSTVGEGTDVVLSIPLKPYRYSDKETVS